MIQKRKHNYEPHYIFTGEQVLYKGVILNRIRFKNGIPGGWIEHEGNLVDNAMVFDNAKVYGNAVVFGNAKIYNGVQVFGNAQVGDNAIVYMNAKIYDNAKVLGRSHISGTIEVNGNTEVIDRSLPVEDLDSDEEVVVDMGETILSGLTQTFQKIKEALNSEEMITQEELRYAIYDVKRMTDLIQGLTDDNKTPINIVFPKKGNK